MARQAVAKPAGAGWRENEGSTKNPRGTTGKRVDVVLANGIMGRNWPANGGRPETRWTLIGSPFDIAWYRRTE